MEDSYVLQLSDPKFRDLYLCHCGYAQCEPLHSYGPAARPNYIIHYILKGKGSYQINGNKYSLSQGQGFLIEPDTLTFYQADRQHPWTYLWVGFGGTKAQNLMHDIGLSLRQPTFRSPYGDELKQIVLDMLKHTQSTTTNFYYLHGKLYEFFSVLTREIALKDQQSTMTDNAYIQEAVTFIRSNYSQGLHVTDIANHLNVNRSYLYTLFKKELDISPKDFLTKFCISRAKEQLTLTGLSIENVAHSCGYHDALVFSKTFKAQTGLTPTEYRKRNRTEAQNRLVSGQNRLEEMMKGGKKI